MWAEISIFFYTFPLLQIEGDCGGEAGGIDELLVKRHLGPIDMLVALPSVLDEGRPGFLCQGWKT